MKRSITLTLVALAMTACAAPLEFPEWMIPVPDGVPVHEYAAVPFAQRTAEIEVVRDLVIGERPGNDNYTLFNARSVLSGPDGQIYVLDSGNSRLQVFDAAGDHVRTMGGAGQGPGEFDRANAMVIAGDRLVVADFRNRRYTIWTLDGEYLREVKYPTGYSPMQLKGFLDGTMIGRLTIRQEDANAFTSFGTPHYKLFVYDLDLNVVNEVQDFPQPNLPVIIRQRENGGSFSRLQVPSPNSSFAATAAGSVYTSLSEEYQVYALNKNGTMGWALRVSWDRVPIREDEITSAIEQVRERTPDASRSEVDWPSFRPALSRVQVDGHGHVYVFPYPDNDDETDHAAVDVYSDEGEHLFSGFMRSIRWTDAQGDFLYSRESDDDTGEERILRYLLAEPWNPQ
jgi:hypothetical protein